MTPDVDTANHLDGQGHGTYGTDIFVGQPFDGGTVPAACVFVESRPGTPPGLYMHTAKTSLYEPTIEIWVRGATDGHTAAKTLARAIKVTLQTTTVSGYLRTIALDSEPLYLGEDDTGRPLYKVRASVMKKEQ
jgi:hypothetical protein